MSCATGASQQPVRYANGEISYELGCLVSAGFGQIWGHTLSYSNRLHNQGTGINGNSWVIKEIPQLIGDDSRVCIHKGCNGNLWFDYHAPISGYIGEFGVADLLFHQESEFIHQDPNGRITKFYDFSVTPAALRGQFKSFTDPYGNSGSATYNGANQLISFALTGTGGVNSTYTYSYYGLGNPNAGRLQSVKLSVSGQNVRQAIFTYYTAVGSSSSSSRRSSSSSSGGSSSSYGSSSSSSASSNGSLGDLELVTIQQYVTSSWQTLTNTYFRYYLFGQANGFRHGLKYIVSARTYALMVANGITPATATNTQIASYADNYFQYGSHKKVTQESVRGGSLVYQYTYTTSSFPKGDNNWKNKTVETLPDGSQNIVYTNYGGAVMLKVNVVGGTQKWYEFYRYNHSKVVLKANSSAVTGYDDTKADLLNYDSSAKTFEYLSNDSGLISVYNYYRGTDLGTGAVEGYLAFEKVKQGQLGRETKLRRLTYVQRTVGSNTITLKAAETAYRSEAGGGSGAAKTEYAYAWYSGSLQMQQKTTTLPVIPAHQNGSGVADSIVEVFDQYGNLTWKKDQRGFITNFTYDPATGALSERIDDVDMSLITTPGAPSWTTPAGGLHLITDYTFDGLGRTTQVLGPSHDVDLSGTSTPIRRATWAIYQDALLQQWTGMGYATGTGPSYTYTLVNPVTIIQFDAANRVTQVIVATRASIAGALLPTDSFPQSSWVRWGVFNYNVAGLRTSNQAYFNIPGSGSGTIGVNYNQTNYGYDSLQRLNKLQTPGGTIKRLVYNPLNWLMSTWLGTNDTGATDTNPAGSGSPNNMVIVSALEYDGGAIGGDGNLTQLTQYQDASTTRVTNYQYDFRNRQIEIDGEIDFCQLNTYDNLNLAIKVDRRNTTSTGNLIARTVNDYDNLGRLFRTVRYAVDPATGEVGNGLTDNAWYDPSGNVIQQKPGGSSAWQKTIYDGINRPIKQFLSYATEKTGYPYPIHVAHDTVMQQAENTYDAASNLIEKVTRDRFDNATGTGQLTSPTGVQPQARVSFIVYWPDPLGRIVNRADYGTNGGVALSPPATAPARSITILLTSTVYNNRGEPYQVVDPKGTVNQTTFDDAGRLTQLLENYVSGGTGPDQNRESDYTYNADSRVATFTAKNSSTGNQVTSYTYGTTLSNSDAASNDWLRTVTYPDGNAVTMACNRLGQTKQLQDQLGTVHSYLYDLLGRLQHDCITTLGSGVDGTVLRISRVYEVRGMLQNLTSYNNATVGSGSVVNDVLLGYNVFAQLAGDYQSHSGAAGTSSPSVQYGYANGSANTVRPVSVTYPSGRVLNYSYGTAGGMNDLLSRIESLLDNDGTTQLAVYTRVGVDRTVQVSSPQPGTELTYIKLAGEPNGDGGDQYTGWDRFSRVIDQRWITTGSGTALERVQYGFDQAGNRIWRDNLVGDATSANQDEFYTYDGLYQLATLQRGQLNSGKTGISGTPAWEEDFTFDPTGNWNNYLTKLTGTTNLNQNRTYNQANSLLTLGGSSTYISVNAAGNTVLAPVPGTWASGYALTYDAWNRLVKVMSGMTTVAVYAYDGKDRRTTKTTSSVRHYYYCVKWQIMEERVGSGTSFDRQFVWGLRYVDDLILRDRTSERLYAFHDYFSCTAVADTTGTVQERYGYNGFGQPRVMTPTFGSRSSSSYDWETLFDAYRWDSETGLYQVRYRYLHPTLGRWLSRDPLYEPGFTLRDQKRLDAIVAELAEGPNLYEFVRNCPTIKIDLYGLAGGATAGGIPVGPGANYPYGLNNPNNADPEAPDLDCGMEYAAQNFSQDPIWTIGVVIGYPISLILRAINAILHPTLCPSSPTWTSLPNCEVNQIPPFQPPVTVPVTVMPMWPTNTPIWGPTQTSPIITPPTNPVPIDPNPPQMHN